MVGCEGRALGVVPIAVEISQGVVSFVCGARLAIGAGDKMQGSAKR